MLTTHAMVWIDHVQAHLIRFDEESSETKIIHTLSTHPHLHTKAGHVGSGRAPESRPYFDEIAENLKDAKEILIIGPGFEKLELMKDLLKHHTALAHKVVSVETVDHPTDPQLAAYARKYFLRADKLVRA